MRDHRKLKAFELSDALVMEIYLITRSFPKEERYGLSSQMRRSAISVSANIVEGCARHSIREYLQFLNIAFGSLRELGYFIDLTHRLNYIKDDVHAELEKQQDEAARVLSGLIKSLRDIK